MVLVVEVAAGVFFGMLGFSIFLAVAIPWAGEWVVRWFEKEMGG
jgi:hypothetical protein